MPLAPDAPGDNQFVDTSLSPEHIQLWTRDSHISFVIAPGDPFLGRLTWLIAANSQFKHGMRSWWLACGSSSKHGRKTGSGRVAFIKLGYLGL